MFHRNRLDFPSPRTALSKLSGNLSQLAAPQSAGADGGHAGPVGPDAIGKIGHFRGRNINLPLPGSMFGPMAVAIGKTASLLGCCERVRFGA